MEEEELKANDLLDAILETNEKIQIPQFDEAEIPQSIQSKELDRSNEGSSIPVQNLVEENPPVTCASTIYGDESNEGEASSLEGGLIESEGNDRAHEFHEVMGDSVEEKESNFDGSHQLQQLAEKDDNFLSFEEALVEKGETVSLLEEGLGEKGGEVKAQCDEVMQESVDEKLSDLDGTHQNEHLKEEVLPSNFQKEKASSFEEALDVKDEKASSLEEGLGGKGVETHVLGEVKDEKVSLLQEELAGKEKKASTLKEENSGEEEIPILEPSVSTVDEQAVEEKEMLNGKRPQLAEGDEKSYPLQEALVEKDKKVSPFKEGLVVKEETKDRVLDEAIQENVEQRPSDFGEEIAEKDKRALSFQGESVEMDKEESDEKEEAEEMDIDEGGPAMAAGRRTAMKRKSGRPRASQGRRVRVRSKPKEDESLCFICFDGGDLVVCDHRSCPKVYHPSCVNRDEEYFKAKGQWICGWHICSNCQKSAYYMCYTCTYSVCKGCIKGAEFVCVRGNKGFCQDCMKTVMLIETNKHSDETTDMVDFDDKTSWLSLFKDYWLELNAKLSLTIEELMRARNPLKEANVASSDEETLNKMRVHQCKEDPLENSGNAYDDRGSSSSHSTRHKESTSAMKLKKRSRDTSNKESKEAKVERSSISGDIEWASKDLLKFVAHMKNGDKSVLSHFDVQALLLQYIKQNNLRDPRRKSQIICDSRLMALFGKSRVGHLEMLKLLEPHFLIKEASLLATDDNQGGVVDPDPSQIDAEGNSAATMKIPFDTRRKSRRRIEGGLTSLDEYAAIDVHNVSLLYLRRNLMENLPDDIDMFNENVVGAFVRIRISSAASNKDIYRLVQVVGTGKAAGTYKTGKKATDITLEILNLDKREIITIDLISNQDFTEEECKRLRQSVKCGFIDRLTVAQVQVKARGLHAVRANDWLESEKLRLGHLRDRASEKGHKKELRECVEKLQLLNTPEEHIRRLNEVPEIHVDPKMDPGYESTEDEEDLNSEGQDKNKMLKYSFRDRDESSARRVGSGTWKNPDVAFDSNKSAPKAGVQDVALPTVPSGRTDGPFTAQGNDACQVSSPKTPKAIVNATGSDDGIQKNSQPVIEPAQLSGIQPQIAPQPLSTNAVSANNPSETDKLWHYQDPAGKIQGPFSMTQLRKWSSSGFFPTNLRIWRISEKQEDSILLTDAVSGKFHKDLQKQEPQRTNTSQPTNVTAMVDPGADNLRGGMRGNNISQPPQPSLSSPTNIGGISPMDGRHATSSTGCESSKNSNAWPGQSQVYDCPRQVNPFSRNSPQQPSFQGRDGRGDNNGRWNRSHGRQNSWNSNRPRRFQPNGRGYERQHPYRSSSGQQFAGEQPKVRQPANLPAHAPHPGSIDWASLQGALNRIIPSPSPCNLTSSTINSVGGCASNALPNGNPAVTQENIGVLNNFQQQNKPLESTTPVTSVNHAVYSGSGATQIVDGSNSKQSLKGNNSITTLNGDQVSAGVINSESMQPANPQMNEVGDHTVSLNKPDPTKTFTEVFDTSASENKCSSVNGTELGSSAVALNPVGSSNLPDASASTSKAHSESQCFAPISAQKQGTNNPSINPAQPLNMAYPTIPGSANIGWGMVAHGPMDVNWGALANTNMSWGPAAQAIMNPNLGWAIPTQGMPMQVNSALHAGWAAPVMGNANPNPSWVAPPTLGNANQSATWGTMMPGTGQGSMNNASNQNAGDGGSLHNPPPGEQRVGVCKFHENGHCKKGTSCNYIHL